MFIGRTTYRVKTLRAVLRIGIRYYYNVVTNMTCNWKPPIINNLIDMHVTQL